jgi:hypothetical protein
VLTDGSGVVIYRSMISFDIASICSHELGQSDVLVGCSGTTAVGGATNNANNAEAAQAARIEELEESLVKVQNFILLHNERLSQLEEHSTAALSAPHSVPLLLPAPGGAEQMAEECGEPATSSGRRGRGGRGRGRGRGRVGGGRGRGLKRKHS